MSDVIYSKKDIDAMMTEVGYIMKDRAENDVQTMFDLGKRIPTPSQEDLAEAEANYVPSCRYEYVYILNKKLHELHYLADETHWPKIYRAHKLWMNTDSKSNDACSLNAALRMLKHCIDSGKYQAVLDKFADVNMKTYAPATRLKEHVVKSQRQSEQIKNLFADEPYVYEHPDAAKLIAVPKKPKANGKEKSAPVKLDEPVVNSEPKRDLSTHKVANNELIAVKYELHSVERDILKFSNRQVNEDDVADLRRNPIYYAAMDGEDGHKGAEKNSTDANELIYNAVCGDGKDDKGRPFQIHENVMFQCKPYYDFDCKSFFQSEGDDAKRLAEREEWYNKILYVLKATFKQDKNLRVKIFMFDGSGFKKSKNYYAISFHAIVSGVACASPLQVPYLYPVIGEDGKEIDLTNVMDCGIYSEKGHKYRAPYTVKVKDGILDSRVFQLCGYISTNKVECVTSKSKDVYDEADFKRIKKYGVVSAEVLSAFLKLTPKISGDLDDGIVPSKYKGIVVDGDLDEEDEKLYVDIKSESYTARPIFKLRNAPKELNRSDALFQILFLLRSLDKVDRYKYSSEKTMYDFEFGQWFATIIDEEFEVHTLPSIENYKAVEEANAIRRKKQRVQLQRELRYQHTYMDIERVKQIISGLNPKRSHGDYNSWLAGLMAIIRFSIGQGLSHKEKIDLCELFCKLAPERAHMTREDVERDVAREEDKARDTSGARMSLLLRWLAEDNPTLHQSLPKREHIEKTLMKLNGFDVNDPYHLADLREESLNVFFTREDAEEYLMPRLKRVFAYISDRYEYIFKRNKIADQTAYKVESKSDAWSQQPIMLRFIKRKKEDEVKMIKRKAIVEYLKAAGQPIPDDLANYEAEDSEVAKLKKDDIQYVKVGTNYYSYLESCGMIEEINIFEVMLKKYVKYFDYQRESATPKLDKSRIDYTDSLKSFFNKFPGHNHTSFDVNGGYIRFHQKPEERLTGEAAGDENDVIAYDMLMPKVAEVLQNLFEVLASSDEGAYKYILSWIHCAVKDPSKPMSTALVFQGDQGIGKSAFVLQFLRVNIFGFDSSVKVSDAADLAQRFNDNLAFKSLAVIEEFHMIGNKFSVEQAQKIKDIISGETIRIEEKYKSPREIPNRLRVICTSNAPKPIELEKSDRRYNMFEVANTHKSDKAYWDHFTELFADQDVGRAFYTYVTSMPESELVNVNVPYPTKMREFCMKKDADDSFDEFMSAAISLLVQPSASLDELTKSRLSSFDIFDRETEYGTNIKEEGSRVNKKIAIASDDEHTIIYTYAKQSHLYEIYNDWADRKKYASNRRPSLSDFVYKYERAIRSHFITTKWDGLIGSYKNIKLERVNDRIKPGLIMPPRLFSEARESAIITDPVDIKDSLLLVQYEAYSENSNIDLASDKVDWIYDYLQSKYCKLIKKWTELQQLNVLLDLHYINALPKQLIERKGETFDHRVHMKNRDRLERLKKCHDSNFELSCCFAKKFEVLREFKLSELEDS